MSSGKNESFVANRGDIETKWIFEKLSDDNSTANVREFLSVLNHLFNALDGFVYPTNIEYVLWVLGSNSDEPVPVTGEIESPDGITASELTAEIQGHSETGAGTVRRLTINENKTRIKLDDGEYLIDTCSNQYRTWMDGDVLEQPPAEDLLNIDIFYANKSDNEPHNYQIIIKTYTDIWFEDTKIGERNRERLTDALDQFCDAIDVDQVDFESRLVSKQALREDGFKGLLPERYEKN